MIDGNDSIDSIDSNQVTLIGQLISSKVFSENGLEEALRETASIGTRLLNVDRISIWLLQSNEMVPNYTLAYNSEDDTYETGTIADISERSDYLEILKRRHVVAIDDTGKGAEIVPLRNRFFIPSNIGALMDGAIHQNDRFMGSVIASHFNGPRQWTSEEIACLSVICQHVANLLERSSRQIAETRLQDWIETSSVARWEMDANLIFTKISSTNSSDWRHMDEQYLGKTRWDAVGARLDDPVWREHYETLNAHLPFRNFVYSTVTPNSGDKILSISGNPLFDEQNNFLGYRGTTNDVTKFVGAELALEETEQKFRDLVDGSLQGISVTVDHLVVFANDAFAQAFGYSTDEIIGMRDDDLVAPQDRKPRREYREGKLEGLTQMSGLTKSGEVRQFEVFAKNMAWNGEPGRLLTLFDITDKKIAEEHLRHAQKMEAVGELTGGIAHDFNNLLSVILGNAELLEDSFTKADEMARQNLSNIQRAAQRGAELTRRLLAFARRQPLSAEKTNIPELIAGLHSMFGHTLGETIKLRTMFEPGIAPAQVDPAQLENVLLNLAINARDAMPEGGSFSIRCSQHSVTSDAEQQSGDLNAGDYVRIDVIDTGSGIPAEIIGRVFDPFFTTKEVGKGTGLGLSMVFGFAQQSGGHVSISSPPGKGATICLFLPTAG